MGDINIFIKFGELLLFLMIFHMNESFMKNILSFVDISNIVGFHIKMDTSKEKVIDINMHDRLILHFRACA